MAAKSALRSGAARESCYRFCVAPQSVRCDLCGLSKTLWRSNNPRFYADQARLARATLHRFERKLGRRSVFRQADRQIVDGYLVELAMEAKGQSQ